MRILFIYSIAVLLSACATAPSYQNFLGGDRVDQPGVSFILPVEKSWAAGLRSDYQILLGAKEISNDETLVIGASAFPIPAFSSDEEFLDYVKTGRVKNSPTTGRFEVIKNDERPYQAREETCVKHESVSKDFTASAKRAGGYTILETFGMNCVHPLNQSVGVWVELSRKAPPDTKRPEFRDMGERLLQSVIFTNFVTGK